MSRRKDPPSAPAAAVPDADADDALIFQWRGRPRRGWRLGLILLGSLLAHAATFYLLQVAYTPTASLLPPAAQVVMLAPEDPARQAALDQWLQMADPALATAPPSNDAGDALQRIGLRYVPSYAGVAPAFKSLEPAAEAAGASFAVPARTRPPGPVPALLPAGTATATDDAVLAAAAALPTRLVFQGPVKGVAPVPLPPWNFTATRGARPLEPTRFIVGVRPGGGPASLFRQQAPGESATGGDPVLEEAARDYLARLVFQETKPAPGDAQPPEIVWGWATFYWGREVYR